MSRASRWATPVAAAIAIAVVLGATAAVLAVQGAFDRPSPFAGTLSPGPASCPQTSEHPAESALERVGQPLLPTGATLAYLCIYQPDPNELVRTYTLANKANELVDFLNGLPQPPEPSDIACLQSDDATLPLGFLVIVGYADQHAIVRPAGCGVLESMGAMRYETGLELFAFWGVTPHDAWPEASATPS